MPRRQRLRKLTLPVLPTMFTLANGVCGLGSITLATNHTPGVSQTDLAFYAGLLVFLGNGVRRTGWLRGASHQADQ